LSERKKQDTLLLEKIREIYNNSRNCYGSPRIHAELREDNILCSRKRVIRLMREHDIQAKQKRKFKAATTDSNHSLPIAENKLQKNFIASKPNEVWTGDITYIPTQEGWLYLAVVLDLFSRQIVGWAMGARMTKELVMDALLMAYWKRKPKAGLMHHSDRGSQYASYGFQGLLSQLGMECSMSGKGCCYDNAVTESFFHTLKVELVYGNPFESREQAKGAIFEYIECFYNPIRKHSTLGYCAPIQFEQKWEKVA
jgi:putative transposase